MSLAGIADSVLSGGREEPRQLVDEPIGEAMDVLKVYRRRSAMQHVAEAGEPVTLRHLSREIAGEEHGKKPVNVRSNEYKRVYTALYQRHLKKLAEVNIVEFDKQRGVIRAGPAIDGYLALLAELQPRTGGEAP